MDCDWVGLLLDDHLDGACHDALREKIDAHLAACAACRAERDARAAVEARLGGLRVPEPPPGLVDGAVRTALRPVPAGSRRRDLRTLAAAAAVLLAAAGALSFAGDDSAGLVPAAPSVGEMAAAASAAGRTVTDAVVELARDLR